MQEILEESGFKGAAAQKSGVIGSFTNRFALPHFPVAGTLVLVQFYVDNQQRE